MKVLRFMLRIRALESPGSSQMRSSSQSTPLGLLRHGNEVALCETERLVGLCYPVNLPSREVNTLRNRLWHPALAGRLAGLAELDCGSIYPAMRRAVRDVHESPFPHPQLPGLVRLPVVRRDVQQHLRLLAVRSSGCRRGARARAAH